MKALYVKVNTGAGTPAAVGKAAAETLRVVAEKLECHGLAPDAHFLIRSPSGQHIGHAGHEDDREQGKR